MLFPVDSVHIRPSARRTAGELPGPRASGGSSREGSPPRVLAYGKPSHFFRFGVDCHHYGSGASGSRIPAANVDPSIPVLWRDPVLAPAARAASSDTEQAARLDAIGDELDSFAGEV